ncbi:MAG: hypothetical protein HY958_13335 [Bacteroidia bacterium]|nr:hypothetical protein [Bacteroidia bacterium]
MKISFKNIDALSDRYINKHINRAIDKKFVIEELFNSTLSIKKCCMNEPNPDEWMVRLYNNYKRGENIDDLFYKQNDLAEIIDKKTIQELIKENIIEEITTTHQIIPGYLVKYYFNFKNPETKEIIRAIRNSIFFHELLRKINLKYEEIKGIHNLKELGEIIEEKLNEYIKPQRSKQQPDAGTPQQLTAGVIALYYYFKIDAKEMSQFGTKKGRKLEIKEQLMADNFDVSFNSVSNKLYAVYNDKNKENPINKDNLTRVIEMLPKNSTSRQLAQNALYDLCYSNK